MSGDERQYALRVAIYDVIGYHLGIDDSDDGACDAKNAAAIDVLRLIEREMADAEDLAAKIEAAWEWIARTEPHPDLNGGLLCGLRAALSGCPDRCDRCHRPLPHSEAESRVCVPDVPAARPKIHPLAEAQRERDTVALDGSAGPAARDEPEPERSTHTLTEYGTTNCPAEGVRAFVDDGECSACGGPVQVTTPEDKR